MITVLTILIITIFVTATIWVTGIAANARKRITVDHTYRMARLHNDEEQNVHHRYLEAAAADRTPSDAELATRTAEATARKIEADIALVKERARARSKY
jgi:hypothetical protein